VQIHENKDNILQTCEVSMVEAFRVRQIIERVIYAHSHFATCASSYNDFEVLYPWKKVLLSDVLETIKCTAIAWDKSLFHYYNPHVKVPLSVFKSALDLYNELIRLCEKFSFIEKNVLKM